MAIHYPLTIEARGETDVFMSREFDAPRELVWDAWTKPELIKRWLYGPDGWEMIDCRVDLRVGGAYRFVTRHKESKESMGWGGVYTEIEHPSRLANTEKFDEAWYPGESLIVSDLIDLGGGRTRFDSTLRFASQEGRDMVMASGMASGVEDSYDRMASVLEEEIAAAAS